MENKVQKLPAWECMMKKMVWKQIGAIQREKILDFGSGLGITSCYYAKDNDVIAIEPDEESVNMRWKDYPYTQLHGSLDKLKEIENETIDYIFCHNVLEYAKERKEIFCEFSRILKPNGKISLVKHNRAGRVMQMVILLDDFKQAHSLLDGHDSTASKYGAICYYEDEEIEKWAPDLKITKTLGMRTFWDLQQKQELHSNANWQDNMLDIEMRVSDIEEYKNIAFFHHLIIEKVEA